MNKIPYEVLELKRIIEEDVPATPRLTINPLTYIIAMFFAKFDKEAYQSFGFKTITNAHQEIANILKVKPRTLENTRDNFDSQYNHPGGRKGHKDKKGSNTKK